MKCSYRGVSYEENAASTLEVTEGEIGGTYRGHNWRVHYLRHIPEPAPVHDLKWRGVAYRTGQPKVIESIPVVSSVATVAVKRSLTRQQRKKVLDEIATMHLKNIQRSLEHRLEVAKANGDENLVRVLEKESEQMMLSL
ncbi:MAG TPA: hypothetical protein DCY91_02640 [Cyanobacteria bacterium UBA11370]|nr:hypothetical protein [Cyanobacteria bacterium UBA11370]HBY79903.1 hypothetical protein [Cyanobacteria bacterium UBA11148]